jgi:hypothetical protein
VKSSVYIVILLLAVACRLMAGERIGSITELPRPNSGTFSFQQAEARKFEILSNAPTAKLDNTDVGLCIHIGKDDSITAYNHILKFVPECSGTRTNQSVAEIVKLVDWIPVAGAPRRVLITSDVPLHTSKVFQEVLKVLFVPSIQLLYVRTSEPGGAANGSQPVRLDTNRTPSAAGSRR